MSPVEGTPNKDKSKLTREEREAQYKAARDRIFGDFQESVTSESVSTGENSASMSRSSSSSGKRKARKHKTPKDDSFEARSAFVPSYAPMHVPQMQPQYQPHYSEQGYQSPYQGPTNGFGTNMNYVSTPTPSYPNFDPSMQFNGNMGYGQNSNQPFSPADSWSSAQPPSSAGYFNYSASPTNYQQNMSPIIPPLNNQFMQQQHPGMQQQQSWMNNQYQAPYSQPPGPPSSNMNGWSGYQSNATMNNTASYPYGQTTSQSYAGNANSNYNAQYPPPNNHSRSLFNPQTRSFVPSNVTSRTGGRNGRKKPSPSSSQNRVNTIPKPFTPDTYGSMNPSPSRTFERGSNNLSSLKAPKEDSLQQKYGAPAHLPKKPPPSQVPALYDVESINNTIIGSGPVPLSTEQIAANNSGQQSGASSA